MLEITNENFEEIVLKSDKPVLVDNWAEWCRPCKALTPIIEALAEEHPEFTFVKLNTDDNPELSKQLKIKSVPALIVFKNGIQTNSKIGMTTKENILKLFE